MVGRLHAFADRRLKNDVYHYVVYRTKSKVL